LCLKYFNYDLRYDIYCDHLSGSAHEDCKELCTKCFDCGIGGGYGSGRYDQCLYADLKPQGQFSRAECKEACSKFGHSDPGGRYISCNKLEDYSEAAECRVELCKKCGECDVKGKRQYDCWEFTEPSQAGCRELCLAVALLTHFTRIVYHIKDD